MGTNAPSGCVYCPNDSPSKHTTTPPRHYTTTTLPHHHTSHTSTPPYHHASHATTPPNPPPPHAHSRTPHLVVVWRCGRVGGVLVWWWGGVVAWRCGGVFHRGVLGASQVRRAEDAFRALIQGVVCGCGRVVWGIRRCGGVRSVVVWRYGRCGRCDGVVAWRCGGVYHK